MMLRQLLQRVESAQGPVNLSALGQEMGVDVAVLEGMLQYWVRKGRLTMDGGSATTCAGGCSISGGGGGSCAGMTSCPFVARLPVTYRLNLDE